MIDKNFWKGKNVLVTGHSGFKGFWMSLLLEKLESNVYSGIGIDDQNYIEASITRNSKGRFVRRPLEDQCPFIDRSVFLKEMIVEPIDQ